MDSDRSDLLTPRPVPIVAVRTKDSAIDGLAPPSVLPARPDGEPRSRRSAIAAGVLMVVLMAVSVVAVVVGWQAHARLRHTNSSLVAERALVQRTLVSLAEARGSLASVSSQSAAAAATVATEEHQLAGVQTQLANAQANEVSQGVNIADLDQCLAGVEQALNEVSLGNPTGAASTLHAVATDCQSAEPSG